MNPAILQHIRNILSEYIAETDIDQQLAVREIVPILETSGLSLKRPLPASISFKGPFTALGSYTNFFTLNSDTINTLTLCLLNNTHIEKVSEYAASIQRFIEINYGYLFEKTREKATISPDKIRLLYLKATAFLLDYYYYAGDLRYLNTCLKVMDYNWIFSLNNIKKEKTTLYTLLECRLWIMTEYALNELEKNEKSRNILS